MNIIHLYDVVLWKEGDHSSLCGKESVIPGKDSVPIRRNQNHLPIDFCEKCLKSDHAIFWHLANI